MRLVFWLDLKKFLTTVSHGDDKTQTHGDKSALVLAQAAQPVQSFMRYANDGWQVTIAARRIEQAQQLALTQ